MHDTDRYVMRIVEIFFPMGETCEDMNYSPSDEKTYHYIPRIMYAGDDSSKAGNKAQEKKRYRHTWFI